MESKQSCAVDCSDIVLGSPPEAGTSSSSGSSPIVLAVVAALLVVVLAGVAYFVIKRRQRRADATPLSPAAAPLKPTRETQHSRKSPGANTDPKLKNLTFIPRTSSDPGNKEVALDLPCIDGDNSEADHEGVAAAAEEAEPRNQAQEAAAEERQEEQQQAARYDAGGDARLLCCAVLWLRSAALTLRCAAGVWCVMRHRGGITTGTTTRRRPAGRRHRACSSLRHRKMPQTATTTRQLQNQCACVRLETAAWLLLCLFWALHE